MAVVAAPLEVGYGNKCGVQLRHGSCWSAALPTAPLKQIFSVWSIIFVSLQRGTGSRKHRGGVSGVCVGASPAAGGWDGKEGLSKPCLCNHLAEDRCCSST